MSSGPIVAMILAKEKSISYWRELIGPTNTIKARQTHPDRYSELFLLPEKDYIIIYLSLKRAICCSIQQNIVLSASSLRSIYGTDEQRNGVHGSDSYSSADREIRFFFPDGEFQAMCNTAKY